MLKNRVGKLIFWKESQLLKWSKSVERMVSQLGFELDSAWIETLLPSTSGCSCFTGLRWDCFHHQRATFFILHHRGSGRRNTLCRCHAHQVHSPPMNAETKIKRIHLHFWQNVLFQAVIFFTFFFRKYYFNSWESLSIFWMCSNCKVLHKMTVLTN